MALSGARMQTPIMTTVIPRWHSGGSTARARERGFTQVDVFSDEPLRGNPVAVVHDAEDLDDEQMAAVARWTNLSETTFLLPPTDPTADYRLRIFTPSRELPFAGHPTLGSAWAWVAAGGMPQRDGRLVQQCPAGLVALRARGARWSFAAPSLVRSGPIQPRALVEVVAALGLTASDVLDAAWVDNGPGWAGLLLRDADLVLGLEPPFPGLGELDMVGVVGAYPSGSAAAFEVRAFAPAIGIAEDPVTGSLNAGLGQWLIGAGHAPRHYVAAQGTRLQRRGRVHVEWLDDQVWVGGATIGTVRGTVSLPT